MDDGTVNDTDPSDPSRPGLWARFWGWLTGHWVQPRAVAPADRAAGDPPVTPAIEPARGEPTSQTARPALTEEERVEAVLRELMGGTSRLPSDPELARIPGLMAAVTFVVGALVT